MPTKIISEKIKRATLTHHMHFQSLIYPLAHSYLYVHAYGTEKNNTNYVVNK